MNGTRFLIAHSQDIYFLIVYINIKKLFSSGTSGCWARVESGTGRLEPIGASQELRLDNVLYQEGGEYRCVAPSKESTKKLEAIRNALSVQIVVSGKFLDKL